MPNENNVLFSDVDTARSLAQKLAGREAASPVAEGETPEFVSFRRAATPVGSSQPQGAPQVSPPPPPLSDDSSGWGEGAWQQRLEWLAQTAEAKCAVVLDRQGLVIATHGDITPEKAQAWGGRLLLMLDQAAHIDDRHARCVCLEFDGEWLTGIAGTGPNHPEVAIAVLAQRPVADTIRVAFATLFSR